MLPHISVSGASIITFVPAVNSILEAASTVTSLLTDSIVTLSPVASIIISVPAYISALPPASTIVSPPDITFILPPATFKK